MINAIFLLTIWVLFLIIFEKWGQANRSKKKVEKLEDEILELKEDIASLEDEVFDLREEGGKYNGL